MNMKDILTTSVKKLGGEHKSRLIAEFIAVKARGILADRHFLPGDHRGFVNWAKSQPKYLQIFLKQVLDGLAATAHALPGGENVTSLVIAEIASELFAQSGYVMTHADELEIQRALPEAYAQVVQEVRSHPDKRGALSKFIGNAEEWEELVSKPTTRIANLRRRLHGGGT